MSNLWVQCFRKNLTIHQIKLTALSVFMSQFNYWTFACSEVYTLPCLSALVSRMFLYLPKLGPLFAYTALYICSVSTIFRTKCLNSDPVLWHLSCLVSWQPQHFLLHSISLFLKCLSFLASYSLCICSRLAPIIFSGYCFIYNFQGLKDDSGSQ